MKTNFLLGAGLLMSALGFGQVNLPATGTANAAGNPYSNNVHIGKASGALESGNNNNVFLGYYSGTSNTIGHSNVFLGHESGILNGNGLANVFVGSRAGYNNTTGYYNTYIGSSAGLTTNSGVVNNCYFGTSSGREALGSLNVFIGSQSGFYSKNSNNVAVGYQAGFNSGKANTMIGYKAGKFETGSNKLYISNDSIVNPLVYGEFDNKILKFNATKVGIGSDFGTFPAMTTIPNASSYRFFVKGGILAEEVRIRLQADWADYVFTDGYKLLSLQATEEYINENGHLPNMPSAALVKEEGIEVGNIIKLQQEKIEELTLHLINQGKEIDLLKEQNKQLEELKAQVQLLMNKK